MSRGEAMTWAATAHSYDRSTLSRWRRIFEQDLELPSGKQGVYYRPSPIDDPDLALMLRLWVRARSAESGVPTLTAAIVCRYINAELLPEMAAVQPFSEATALKWLHALGFAMRLRGKHIYIDGHERDDVRTDRTQRFIPAYNDIYRQVCMRCLCVMC